MCLNLALNETPYAFPYSEEAVTRVILLDPSQGKVYSERADCLALPEFSEWVATREVAKQVYHQDHIFQNPSCYQESGEQGNVRYLSTLVESSAAPRSTVPKSGRKPEVYIAHIDALPWEKEMTTVVDHYVIDTPFREEFDARVRELMFLTLRGMYQER